MNGALQIRSAALGMTKRRGPWQGKGGCWRKGRLLDNSFSRPYGTFQGRTLTQDSRPGLNSVVPAGLNSVMVGSHADTPLTWTNCEASRQLQSSMSRPRVEWAVSGLRLVVIR